MVKEEVEINPARAALGRELAACRVRAGLSQARLAEVVGVHRTRVSGMEQGASVPDVFLFTAIMRACGVLYDEEVAILRSLRDPTLRTLARGDA